MAFLRQAGASVLLVTLTLSFQSAAMAALIHWARAHFARAVGRFGLLHSAVLLVRFTTVIFVSHVFQIVLWAGFYRWNCFPTWGICILHSHARNTTLARQSFK